MYNGGKYSGRKGFYITCGGGQTEPWRAICIPLFIWKPTIISDTGVQDLVPRNFHAMNHYAGAKKIDESVYRAAPIPMPKTGKTVRDAISSHVCQTVKRQAKYSKGILAPLCLWILFFSVLLPIASDLFRIKLTPKLRLNTWNTVREVKEGSVPLIRQLKCMDGGRPSVKQTTRLRWNFALPMFGSFLDWRMKKGRRRKMERVQDSNQKKSVKMWQLGNHNILELQHRRVNLFLMSGYEHQEKLNNIAANVTNSISLFCYKITG